VRIGVQLRPGGTPDKARKAALTPEGLPADDENEDDLDRE
jgi:hypothetical protein